MSNVFTLLLSVSFILIHVIHFPLEVDTFGHILYPIHVIGSDDVVPFLLFFSLSYSTLLLFPLFSAFVIVYCIIKQSRIDMSIYSKTC